MVHVVGAATGFPPYYYQQAELTAMLKRLWAVDAGVHERLERFHQNMHIQGRHMALPIDAYERLGGFQESNDHYIRVALDLGERVLCDLLGERLDPRDLALLAVTTITGLAVPSLDARLMNRIPFGPHLKRMPLFGLGCMGGAAGLARTADYLEGHPDEAAILLSVELCSLTIQKDDLSVANLVSSGLFGDGSAAVLLVGDRHPLAQTGLQPRIIANRSVFFPETEYIMGYEIRDTGFKMVLGPNVGDVVSTALLPELEDFLAGYGHSIDRVQHWLVHPGGPKILQSVEASLGLTRADLGWSYRSLERVGNLSSASVLVILNDLLQSGQAKAGDVGMLMAFGPGFSAEMVLLEW